MFFQCFFVECSSVTGVQFGEFRNYAIIGEYVVPSETALLPIYVHLFHLMCMDYWSSFAGNPVITRMQPNFVQNLRENRIERIKLYMQNL